jgi:hypothetical protein
MKQSTDTQAGMALLAAGIPLTLLLDLVSLDVSRSREIATTERADLSWIHAA